MKMGSYEQFDLLYNKMKQEVGEYISFCRECGYKNGVERGEAFLQWLNEQETQEAIERIRREFATREHQECLRAACRVFDLIRQEDMSQLKTREKICAWAEDVLWVLFALKDLDVKTAV